jgi:hypothetical protein
VSFNARDHRLDHPIEKLAAELRRGGFAATGTAPS